jgi:hypothetical protein
MWVVSLARRWFTWVRTPTSQIQEKSTADVACRELTLSQLQRTCEAILFWSLDKSVFRKQLKDARYLVPTGRGTAATNAVVQSEGGFYLALSDHIGSCGTLRVAPCHPDMRSGLTAPSGTLPKFVNGG